MILIMPFHLRKNKGILIFQRKSQEDYKLTVTLLSKCFNNLSSLSSLSIRQSWIIKHEHDFQICNLTFGYFKLFWFSLSKQFCWSNLGMMRTGFDASKHVLTPRVRNSSSPVRRTQISWADVLTHAQWVLVLTQKLGPKWCYIWIK